jgi:hypothetical protein
VSGHCIYTGKTRKNTFENFDQKHCGKIGSRSSWLLLYSSDRFLHDSSMTPRASSCTPLWRNQEESERGLFSSKTPPDSSKEARRQEESGGTHGGKYVKILLFWLLLTPPASSLGGSRRSQGGGMEDFVPFFHASSCFLLTPLSKRNEEVLEEAGGVMED